MNRVNGSQKGRSDQEMSGANASPKGRSDQEMSGANASPTGRSDQEMSGANASPTGRSDQEMSGANASPTGRSHQEMSTVLDNAKFGADGLIPAVVQDARTREVLTVAYMNKEALQLTLERNETYFWSRSRQQLWHKGETSGNFQKVVRVSLDCDND